MYRIASRGLAALALSAALGGCFTVTYQARGGEDMPFDAQPGATMLGSFKREIKQHHFLFGLISTGDPDVVGVVLDETRRRNGARASGLRITHERGFVDALLMVVTYGIYTPTTTTVEGEVVK